MVRAVQKRALIVGITGQDGSYLAEHLLSLDYLVVGMVRLHNELLMPRITHLLDDHRLSLIEGDLLDQQSLVRAIEFAEPEEIYNLGAQSSVGRSWLEPVFVAEVTGLGALRLLESARMVSPKARFFQASSSEMFGTTPGPHTAAGPFLPQSPYAAAKLFAHTSSVGYRDSFGMHVCCGILFNHESSRRGAEFVTKKVCQAAARAATGDTRPLLMGNLDARRDWGWAPDYVKAMHLMTAQPKPIDLVIATGKAHSVRELCEQAYGCVGLDWRNYVRVDETLLRPADMPLLVGDPQEAKLLLGWRPTISFEEMIQRIVASECRSIGAPQVADNGAE